MILNGKGSSNWLWSTWKQSCFLSFPTGQDNVVVKKHVTNRIGETNMFQGIRLCNLAPVGNMSRTELASPICFREAGYATLHQLEICKEQNWPVQYVSGKQAMQPCTSWKYVKNRIGQSNMFQGSRLCNLAPV